MDLLPENCVAQILSLTSPGDACRLSIISSGFQRAAESDVIWEIFLPPDYREIISTAVSPVAVASKKELFLRLHNPLLIDGGNKTFSIEKRSGKKCYMLSARELSVSWASNPLFWCWKSHLQSRFTEVVELIIVSWLEIVGKINTNILSPNTTYGAFLVFKIADRAFGLDSIPSEVSIEVSNHRSEGTTYLRLYESTKRELLEKVFAHNRIQMLRSRVTRNGGERIVAGREDGWLEIELGEFYNGGERKMEEVKMSFREVKGQHLKGGLIVEGIEIRPK